MYKEKFKPLKFPQDEQKHDHTIEWWYFNGNLNSNDGRSFSYMNTLFSCKPKKVKIPFLERIPLKTSYFSHYLISDHQKHKFQHKINPFCLVNPDSFSKPFLWAMYDNTCLIEETSLFNYHIVNDFVDLKLSSIKNPLLLNKNGFIDLKQKTTYYYSLTHLKTEGIINLGKKWLKVKGLSWMDHQWAMGPLMRGDKWTWFSIQLTDKTEIVCFVYGEDELIYHASIIDSKNRIKSTSNVIISPKGAIYVSKETGSRFNINYEIYLPDWDIQLFIDPVNKAQEMVFGSLNYWEGAIKVTGRKNNKKISGFGFMELVGSKMKKSALNVYLKKFKNEIFNNRLGSVKKELGAKLKAYQ